MNENPEIKLVWEAPPEMRRKTKYAKVLAEIKRHPGRWARVRDNLSQSGAYSASGNLRNLLADDKHWKVTQRPLEGNDDWGVWVIYRTEEQLRVDSKDDA